MNPNPFFSSRKSSSTHSNPLNILDLEAPKMNTLSYTHKLKIALFMLAFVLFGTLSTSLPAYAKTANVPAPCLNHCLRVSRISLEGKDPSGQPTIKAIVTLLADAPTTDAPNPVVSGVQVYGFWKLPNGTTIPVSGRTNAQGQAVFQISDAPGAFTFTIAKVVKTGYTLDRLNSVLTATIH
jgi:hypothetical protein